MSSTDTVYKIQWLLDKLVDEASGITDVILTSSDGMLLSISKNLTRDKGDQIAAISSGFLSLSSGSANLLKYGNVRQVFMEASDGYIIVMPVKRGIVSLTAMVNSDADLGLVSYNMVSFINKCGSVMDLEVRDELRQFLRNK